MNVFSECAAIRDYVSQLKAAHKTIALVPTMGHLHAGHAALIKQAKTQASCVIVSIFVNPTQFDQSSDFDRYPRTLEEDLNLLRELEVEAVFTPQAQALYPAGTANTPKIIIPELSASLEGEYRPGHFDGVCTVVCKLFNIITPHIAVFGMKDYQQLLLIQRMNRDLNFNINILPGETLREADGLAMSSRNSHLHAEQRQQAGQIFRTLQQAKDQFLTGECETIEANAVTALESHGFRVDYVSVRDAENLHAITQSTENVVVLAAAWLGDTRLIDNLLFPLP